MDRTLKEALLAHCRNEAQARVNRIAEVMRRAQETANEDTKSSAGDKYETGRAMMHLEQEKNQRQLTEAQRLMETLSQVSLHKEHEEVGFGSLVETNTGIFFISVSLGRISLEGQTYFAISSVSPMGKALSGKRAGEKASVNGREIQIVSLC